MFQVLFAPSQLRVFDLCPDRCCDRTCQAFDAARGGSAGRGRQSGRACGDSSSPRWVGRKLAGKAAAGGKSVGGGEMELGLRGLYLVRPTVNVKPCRCGGVFKVPAQE